MSLWSLHDEQVRCASDFLTAFGSVESALIEKRTAQRQSLLDLADDFADMICVVESRVTALRRVKAELAGDAVGGSVGFELLRAMDSLLTADMATASELRGLVAKADGGGSLGELVRERRRQAELLRMRQSLAAYLLSATDWHSPSIRHSVFATAGRHTGRVTAYHDDYKRDRHPDQTAWEGAWLEVMVDNPFQHSLRALMTASGMAAFTTILSLVGQDDQPRPVLVGSGVYHECAELLAMSRLGGRIRRVPEGDRSAWSEALGDDPFVVFLDTLCNSAGLAVPDVVWLIETLHDRGRPVDLVLDNTARSVSFQPWRYLPAHSLVRMFVFESLTKYPQLGMDRAAGGVIVSRSADADDLDRLREHLGTNIADVVARLHPWPDRPLLERRLRRIGRNAALIAGIVHRHIASGDIPARLVYPERLATGFRGGLLAIETTAGDVRHYRQLIDAILELGADRGVAICEGTSFGFDTTRVYLTATTTKYGRPFLRLAAGTEPLLGVLDVADVLNDALDRFV